MCMKIVVVVDQLSSVAIRIWFPIEVKKDAERESRKWNIENRW